MSHSHSFSREAESVSFDEETDVMRLERRCQSEVRSNTYTPSGVPSVGPPGSSVSQCEAVKVDEYELRSICDDHNIHEGPFGVVFGDNTPAGDTVHIDDLEEVPDWVGELRERAKKVVDSRDAKLFMTHLGGPEIPVTFATSESEYTAVFNRVDERVEED